jgi:hypothetical protein
VTDLLAMHREPAAAKKPEPAKTITSKEAANPATTIEDLQKQPQPAHEPPAAPATGPVRP